MEKVNNSKIKTNMILIILGKFVSLFGTQIYNFALSYYILKMTGSGITYAISLAVGTLPRAILSPFAGAFSDTFDRKKTIVITDILSGILLFVFYISTLFGEIRMITIYITMFLLSILNIFFTIAVDASLPNLVNKNNLTKINALNQSATSTALIIAPIIGGVAIKFIDVKIFILINAISFVLSGISEMFIRFNLINVDINIKINMEKSTFKSILKNISDGYSYVKENKLLSNLIKFFLLLNFFFTLGYTVPLPYIAVDLLKLNTIQYGLIQSAASVGALLTSIVLTLLPEKIDKYKLFIIFSSVLAIAICTIGVMAVPILSQLNIYICVVGLIFASFLFGISVIMASIPINVMIQDKTPDSYRGRVQGLVKASGTMVGPLALLISGTLIDFIPTYMIPLASGMLMLCSVISLSKKQDLKQYV